MDYELLVNYITFQEQLEFDCLIPSLLKEIKQIKCDKITPVNKEKKKYERKSIEKYRLKNKISSRNCRKDKKLFKELLEEKVIKFREDYTRLTGKKFNMPPIKTDILFPIDSNLSKKERIVISARKCRYNKKLYITHLENEVKLLQREIIKLTS